MIEIAAVWADPWRTLVCKGPNTGFMDVTRSPDMIAARSALGAADLWEPRQKGAHPEETRRCAAHENLRYLLAVFIAAAGTVLLLAGVSSFGWQPIAATATSPSIHARMAATR